MYIEPHADIRTMTQTTRQMYNSFVMDGFTEEQAMSFTHAYWKELCVGSFSNR